MTTQPTPDLAAAIDPVTLSWLLGELEGRIERQRAPVGLETIVEVAECELRAVLSAAKLAQELTALLDPEPTPDPVTRVKALQGFARELGELKELLGEDPVKTVRELLAFERGAEEHIDGQQALLRETLNRVVAERESLRAALAEKDSQFETMRGVAEGLDTENVRLRERVAELERAAILERQELLGLEGTLLLLSNRGVQDLDLEAWRASYEERRLP